MLYEIDKIRLCKISVDQVPEKGIGIMRAMEFFPLSTFTVSVQIHS
jgi:hypothetical protein